MQPPPHAIDQSIQHREYADKDRGRNYATADNGQAAEVHQRTSSLAAAIVSSTSALATA
jgi:hypothetical protein